MEMCLDTKKRVALQLLHFGLHRMPLAEYGRSRWASAARSVPSNPSPSLAILNNKAKEKDYANIRAVAEAYRIGNGVRREPPTG